MPWYWRHLLTKDWRGWCLRGPELPKKYVFLSYLNSIYGNSRVLVSPSFFLSWSHLLTKYCTSLSWRERRIWPSLVSFSPTLSTWSEVQNVHKVLYNFLVFLLSENVHNFLDVKWTNRITSWQNDRRIEYSGQQSSFNSLSQLVTY